MSAASILFAVGGGVAAYKSVAAVSALRKQGHRVRVLMTPAAAHFVTPLTFAAVSGAPVIDSMSLDASQGDMESLYLYLYPATSADVFVLAPATANQMARIAHGFGDDVVCCSALSLPSSCLRFFAPAMNVEMWGNPAVRSNAAHLEAAGWVRIGPEKGHLACGMTGDGRMSEPEVIVNCVAEALSASTAWAGKRVLILSGPTHEHLDPIRYLGNPSSGLMGLSLARAVLNRGAEVDYVSGPVHPSHLPCHARCTVHRVTSAEEMLQRAGGLFEAADIIIYAAAVADYRPITRHAEKLPKTSGRMTLELESTPDIAATLCARKRPHQTAIGFALQTHDGETHAQSKLERKHLDGIVLNYPDSLGSRAGNFTYLAKGRAPEAWGYLDKDACARAILNAIDTHRPNV